jgi:O-acetylhomoserine (thiol)-lyase
MALNCNSSDYRLGTRAVHAGYTPGSPELPAAVPIYATASYELSDSEYAAELFALEREGNIYSRLMNPTCGVLEARLSSLDGGVGALAFASGQAAITATIMGLCSGGENFLASTSLYGGTMTLFTHTLASYGIEARLFDPTDVGAIERLADSNTRAVYIEAMGNPKNDVPDFQTVAAEAHRIGVPLVVDNTVLTPVIFRPLDHGADIVIYSTTKYIGGHGVHVGGAVVDGGRFDWSAAPDRWPRFTKPSEAYHGVVLCEAFGKAAFVAYLRTHLLRDMGAAMSPFAAWCFLLGLETLHLRMPRHCENARILATWLDEHPAVEWVNHPSLAAHPFHAVARKYMPGGGGAIVGFGIKGGKAAGVKFIDSVKLVSHVANIGDAKTLVIHPASTTHQQLSEAEQRAAGVSPEYIRLSVGIEDVDDLKADIDQALAASQR